MSEEFAMRVYEDKPEIEYLAGRAVPKVSPKRRHAIVQGALVTLLRNLARGKGDVGTEWRCHPQLKVPKTSLVPDVAFVSRERLATLDSDEQREEPPFAPDIAIEVRSPSDRLSDVEWKMRAYLEFGGIVALDVLPAERIIRSFTKSGAREFAEQDRYTCDELPWFTLDVRDVFADLEP
jgi:Uma2 family endonuclease